MTEHLLFSKIAKTNYRYLVISYMISWN